MATFRLDPEIPFPLEGQQARDAASGALNLCGPASADGKDGVFNRALNEALDPLRLHPALGVRCGPCGHGIAFIALPTQGVTLVSGNHRRKPRQRRGGVYDLASISDTSDDTGRGLVGWLADAQHGRGSVAPTGDRPGTELGVPQRRIHTCSRCPRKHTNTNTTLLRKYLEAVSRGEHEILLQ